MWEFFLGAGWVGRGGSRGGSARVRRERGGRWEVGGGGLSTHSVTPLRDSLEVSHLAAPAFVRPRAPPPGSHVKSAPAPSSRTRLTVGASQRSEPGLRRRHADTDSWARVCRHTHHQGDPPTPPPLTPLTPVPMQAAHLVTSRVCLLGSEGIMTLCAVLSRRQNHQ